MTNSEHQLWRHHDLECVMISCCAGAELQVRRIASAGLDPAGTSADEILLRELYPTKSDLYERARMLQIEYQQLIPAT